MNSSDGPVGDGKQFGGILKVEVEDPSLQLSFVKKRPGHLKYPIGQSVFFNKV